MASRKPAEPTKEFMLALAHDFVAAMEAETGYRAKGQPARMRKLLAFAVRGQRDYSALVDTISVVHRRNEALETEAVNLRYRMRRMEAMAEAPAGMVEADVIKWLHNRGWDCTRAYDEAGAA